jgi:hypothetical protein
MHNAVYSDYQSMTPCLDPSVTGRETISALSQEWKFSVSIFLFNACNHCEDHGEIKPRQTASMRLPTNVCDLAQSHTWHGQLLNLQ